MFYCIYMYTYEAINELIGTNARFWGNSLQSWRNRARKEFKGGVMVSLRVSLLEGARGDESVVRSARWCNEMRPDFFQKSGFSVRVYWVFDPLPVTLAPRTRGGTSPSPEVEGLKPSTSEHSNSKNKPDFLQKLARVPINRFKRRLNPHS